MKTTDEQGNTARGFRVCVKPKGQRGVIYPATGEALFTLNQAAELAKKMLAKGFDVQAETDGSGGRELIPGAELVALAEWRHPEEEAEQVSVSQQLRQEGAARLHALASRRLIAPALRLEDAPLFSCLA